MITTKMLEELVLSYPICEYATGTAREVPVSDRVRRICETECTRYGKNWSCPPHIGVINDLMEVVRSYKNYMLFSTAAQVTDITDMDACLEAKRAHEKLTREYTAKLSELTGHRNGDTDGFLVLSTGCSICDSCSCPDAPCRHPEERINSVESHGVVIVELARRTGMEFYYGTDSVVYFTLTLY